MHAACTHSCISHDHIQVHMNHKVWFVYRTSTCNDEDKDKDKDSFEQYCEHFDSYILFVISHVANI